MINLDENDVLVRKEVSIVLCLLADAIENDSDLNETREELKALVWQLEYLLFLEG